jgi:hypothetical protein
MPVYFDPDGVIEMGYRNTDIKRKRAKFDAEHSVLSPEAATSGKIVFAGLAMACLCFYFKN